PGESKEEADALEKEALTATAKPDGEPLDDEETGPEARADKAAAPIEAPLAAPGAPPKASAMKQGLEKTRKGFMARINDLLRGGRLDEGLVDELESILVTSDIGIRTAERLLGDLRGELTRKEIADPEAVRRKLRARILEIVK